MVHGIRQAAWLLGCQVVWPPGFLTDLPIPSNLCPASFAPDRRQRVQRRRVHEQWRGPRYDSFVKLQNYGTNNCICHLPNNNLFRIPWIHSLRPLKNATSLSMHIDVAQRVSSLLLIHSAMPVVHKARATAVQGMQTNMIQYNKLMYKLIWYYIPLYYQYYNAI